MTTAYSPGNLRNLFQSPFNMSQWRDLLQHFFKAGKLRVEPERIINCTSDEGYYLGKIEGADNFHIGLFYYKISKGSVANKRVGLRNLVKSFINPTWGEFDAALAVFDSGDHWRLSFISDIKGEATSPKRFTYVFGNRALLYKTPVERFGFLMEKGISFNNLKTAFSVEALSDEFFNKYREQYADFVQYITGKRFVKVGGKWVEKEIGSPDTAFMQAFGNDEKRIRDYVKKMMGRVTFLHFLQRKGWMCGDLNYMQNLFCRSVHQDDYLDAVLEPLFFGILNTRPAGREALFMDYGWDKSLLCEWKDIPYLNGGLFERDEEDEPESRFPAGYFRRLFQFFSEYNFTIDENDPDDAEVGVDPEMLGKIFENLLEDNKDKGAFYTPKEIVRYMCQESLIAYLKNESPVAGDRIRKFVISPEEGVTGIPEADRPKLLEALEEVKICDPAIGSGAFPMGLLNELLRCREALGGKHYDRAEIKKSIIQNNIYGVDIEKGAVDIARLRFWLSIVVDEETPSPLPNLDYKIMQGNSLLEQYRGADLSTVTERKTDTADSLTLFDDMLDFHRKNLRDKITEYYACTDHVKKAELRDEIEDIVKLQLREQGIDIDFGGIDLSANNQFFLWHTWFHDVFSRPSKEGFDIVIGNPPYIEAKKLKHIAGTLKNLYEVYSGTADLSIYFNELGFNLLSDHGIISFITTNKFFNTGYGKKVRRLLSSLTINILHNFEQVEVFEGILVSSVIFNISKKPNNKGNQFVYDKFYKLKCRDFKRQFVERQNSFGYYPQDYLDEREWSFANLAQLKLKEKIESGNTLLKDTEGVHVYRGVTTGYNPAFIISNEQRTQFIAKDYKNEDIIKNMLQGRNIRKWYYNESDENLIFTRRGTDINKYPVIKEYLYQFYNLLKPKNRPTDLEGRKPGTYKWFEILDNTAYYPHFEKNEKIIWGLTADKWAYTLDTEQHYLPSNGYILTSDQLPVRFILGLLNSKVLHHYFSYIGVMTAGGAYTLKASTIEALPIPDSTALQQKEIISLVNKILVTKKDNPQANVITIEADIDRLVYKLYDLTEDDIKILESV